MYQKILTALRNFLGRGLSDANLTAALNKKAEGTDLNWQVSVVDFLSVLGMDSSSAARDELAAGLYVTAGESGSAQRNEALRVALFKKIVAAGGNIPQSVIDADRSAYAKEPKKNQTALPQVDAAKVEAEKIRAEARAKDDEAKAKVEDLRKERDAARAKVEAARVEANKAANETAKEAKAKAEAEESANEAAAAERVKHEKVTSQFNRKSGKRF